MLKTCPIFGKLTEDVFARKLKLDFKMEMSHHGWLTEKDLQAHLFKLNWCHQFEGIFPSFLIDAQRKRRNLQPDLYHPISIWFIQNLQFFYPMICSLYATKNSFVGTRNYEMVLAIMRHQFCTNSWWPKLFNSFNIASCCFGLFQNFSDEQFKVNERFSENW